MAGYKDDKSKVPTEAELEAMLDQESDADFGQTELEVASVDQRAVLKEWTAQDFANIYTRFRPHLERHARRFLRNPSQVDEVVQDAFLYLMVTLPELDSELGVLRFLKWKVRLLCLDVIRASGKAYLSDIDEHPEFKADQPEVGSDLERAEDAAIVRMALAKLQPRHREVLIASIYEEKSTPEIAAQVGLTENATRQLMLRARTALKKALVGEVNTQGMSLSQILSVAAKKAAHDAKQVGAQAMSVIAIAVLGIAAFFNFNPAAQTEQIAVPQPTSSNQPENNSTESVEQTTTEELAEVEAVEVIAETAPEGGAVVQVSLASLDPLADLSPFDPWLVDALFVQGLTSENMLAPTNTSVGDRQWLTVVADGGFWVDATFVANSRTPITDVRLGFVIDGENYAAYPKRIDFLVERKADGLDYYVFRGQIAEILDDNNQTYFKTRMSGLFVSVVVSADPATGKAVGMALEVNSPS
jgi:RNA polymerase sigma factor (sigma-70 family)